MSRRISLIAIGFLGVVLTLVDPLRADPAFRYPEGKYGTAELKYRNHLPVLTVEGSPGEIGNAVGVLALAPGKRVANYPEDLLSKFFIGHLYWPALKVGEGMVEQFPCDYRTELETMARAANVAREKLVVANTLFDLKKVVACSALMIDPNRSSTGGSLMGRNLDYPPLGYIHEFSLVTVYRPKGVKHNFAIIGFPGLVGCLSGMNDAGLALAVLEVPQAKITEKAFDIKGMPYGLCFRRLLEECATIDEAHALLSKMKRTALGNLAVADKSGGAVFEISPQRVVIRRGTSGTTICTNHFLSDELRCRVALNFCHTFDRFTALEKVSHMKKQLGLSELQVALHAAHEHDTLQTMIFEPARLKLHLAIGMVPASQGEMRVLELGQLFRGKGE